MIDTNRPSVARVYDCLLGGKDNYEADRQVLQQVDPLAPELGTLVRASRDWLLRVTRFLAGEARIDQFLDLGAGLPAAENENTHQAAQRHNPDARVVYVDNDPVVAAHGRARLEENDGTRLVMADLTDPDAVFADPDVTGLLDLTRPVALIHSSTMHHVPADDEPAKIMRRYAELLPAGSYVALSHFTDPRDDGPGSALAAAVTDVFADCAAPCHLRSRAEILDLFAGLDLVDPGLVSLKSWWPDGPLLRTSAADAVALGAVARKD